MPIQGVVYFGKSFYITSVVQQLSVFKNYLFFCKNNFLKNIKMHKKGTIIKEEKLRLSVFLQETVPPKSFKKSSQGRFFFQLTRTTILPSLENDSFRKLFRYHICSFSRKRCFFSRIDIFLKKIYMLGLKQKLGQCRNQL